MDDVMRLVREEAERAEARYGPFASTHEALGVLLEEFGELADSIRGHGSGPVAREALQVAAVALRLAQQCLAPTDVFLQRSGLWQS